MKFESLKIICIKGFELYLNNLKTVDIIFQYIPIDSQKLFFTTIFNNKLQEFMNKYMKEPIKIKADLQPPKFNVEQFYIFYHPRTTNKLRIYYQQGILEEDILFLQIQMKQLKKFGNIITIIIFQHYIFILVLLKFKKNKH